MATEDTTYRGTVQKVIPKGKHGPYAVATVQGIGSVTFSLEQPSWNEKRWPEGGSIVVLSDVTKKRAGWRADSGRFLKPSDET